MSFENLFFEIFPRHTLYMEYPFGYAYVELISPVSSKNRRKEADFHLDNRLNVPLNFKQNCTLRYTFS